MNPTTTKIKTVSLQAAADHLGVHYMTAYRYVRLGLLAATKIEGSWAVDTDVLDRFVKPQAKTTKDVAPARERDLDNDREALAAALLDGDEAAAWSLLQDVANHAATIGEVHCDLISPVMEDIGSAWADGRLSIADEHRATATLGRLVPQVGAIFNRSGRRMGTIVLGGLAGDLHALPGTMFADMLRTHGVDVIDLGGAAPASAFIDALQQARTEAVACISVMTDGLDDEVSHLVRDIRREVSGTRIAVGGGAIRSEARAVAVGSEFWAADPRDAAAEIAAAAMALSGARVSA